MPRLCCAPGSPSSRNWASIIDPGRIAAAALGVGSDVPALLALSGQRVRGRGDRLEALAVPDAASRDRVHVAEFDGRHVCGRCARTRFATTAARRNWRGSSTDGHAPAPELLGSALEPAACRANPALADALRSARRVVADVDWHLTGSGGAVFAVTGGRDDAERSSLRRCVPQGSMLAPAAPSAEARSTTIRSSVAVADAPSVTPPTPETCDHPAPVTGIMAHEFAHYEGAVGPEGLRRTVTFYGPIVGGLPIRAWHCEKCGLLRLSYPDGRTEERRLFPGPQPGLLAAASPVATEREHYGMQARVSGLTRAARVHRPAHRRRVDRATVAVPDGHAARLGRDHVADGAGDDLRARRTAACRAVRRAVVHHAERRAARSCSPSSSSSSGCSRCG